MKRNFFPCKSIKTTLNMIFSCAILSGSVWAITAQGNYLCNVSPWLTEHFHEENNLCNVALTTPGKHCIGILSSQCCPDNIAQEHYLCDIGPECTDIFLQENNLRNTVLVCLAQHFVKQLPAQCWPTVHSLVNFVQILPRQHCTRKLLVQYWPRTHSNLFAGK